MPPLRRLLDRLDRPIRFAGRNEHTHLAIKNLEPYVSRQIALALAADVYPSHVETDLLALRQLFIDFDRGLNQVERQRRLAGARAILDRLTTTGTERPAPEKERQIGSGQVSCPAFPAQDLGSVPIQFAKGVGPKRAVLLERLGIRTVLDALWFLPWRYEDRSTITPIDRLFPGTQSTVQGRILRCNLTRTRRRRMTLVEVIVQDETGVLRAVFFNQPYLQTILKPGVDVLLSGRISTGGKGWMDLYIDSPQYEVLDHEVGHEENARLHAGRIVPIYHETKGLTARQMRILMKGLLDQYLREMIDVVPEAIRFKYRLPTIHAALHDVHFPPAAADRDARDRGTDPAHRRLAFEEFFLLQLALETRRQFVKEEIKGIRFNPQPSLLAQLRLELPFRLTRAQERVFSEIQRDMAAPRPMNRLVQGDVGCGKTIVALQAMVMACGSGYQAALMVPTEILAEQHYLNMYRLLGKLGLKVVLLKGGDSTKQRKVVLQQIAAGEAHIIIGTHAIIQKGVRFSALGLAVVDEQHKFGVLQRKTLLEKGYRPDVLILTATPIPRTLAMTVYGDLDVSVIDSLPPGRTPIRTWLFQDSERQRAYRILRDEIQAGRQAYIVYPLVEESEKMDLQAAIQAADRLQAKEFSAYRVGVLHGRMKTAEKARTMAAFQAQAIQILVTTTVVEVGVDIPNATVMLIEHAERFGLAQLHQLRGRVGRSARQSYCLLVTSRAGDTGIRKGVGQERLEALVKTTDGFAIAEEDLRIRGPGEFFGIRQWGIPEFRAADLIRDVSMLKHARHEAVALLKADPHLTAPAHRALREAMLRKWQAKLDLGSVS